MVDITLESCRLSLTGTSGEYEGKRVKNADVKIAEATLAELRDKRSRLLDREKELAQKRQEVSDAAHTGDELDCEAIDKCIDEIIVHDHEVEA